MSVIIQIQGREAIPVRAIPLLVQLGFGSCAGDAVETTHWADWAETFKLQDAACLIAGVSPAKEMVAWADKLPPEARPAFKKLWDSYMRAAGVYKQPELDSADFQKMLHAIGGNDFEAPVIVPARGMIRRQSMLIAPSAELMRKRLESVRVSRGELHRWVIAMGIKSAYSFAPASAVPAPTAATPEPAQTASPVVADIVGCAPEQSLPTKCIADCFDGLNGWDAETWPKRLSGAKWLHPARTALGAAGGAPSTWNPLTLAQLVCDKTKGQRPREQILKTFNSRFNLNPVLEPWKAAFNEYFAMFSESD